MPKRCTNRKCLAGRQPQSSIFASEKASAPVFVTVTSVTIRRNHRLAAAAATIAMAASVLWIRCGPIDRQLLAGVDTPSTVIVDRQGRTLYEALTASGTRVQPLTAATVPPILEAATLAA